MADPETKCWTIKTVSAGDKQGPTIKHTPPESIGEKTPKALEAIVTEEESGSSTVGKVNLCYRVEGGEWKRVTARLAVPDQHKYVAVVPGADLVASKTLEWRFEAWDTAPISNQSVSPLFSAPIVKDYAPPTVKLKNLKFEEPGLIVDGEYVSKTDSPTWSPPEVAWGEIRIEAIIEDQSDFSATLYYRAKGTMPWKEAPFNRSSSSEEENCFVAVIPETFMVELVKSKEEPQSKYIIELYIKATDCSPQANEAYYPIYAAGWHPLRTKLSPDGPWDKWVTVRVREEGANVAYGYYELAVLADTEAPLIVHEPIGIKVPVGADIWIEAAAKDIGTIRKVSLFYREKGQDSFVESEMEQDSRKGEPQPYPQVADYVGKIPGKAVTSNGVEYFIRAEDFFGNVSDIPSETFEFPTPPEESLEWTAWNLGKLLPSKVTNAINTVDTGLQALEGTGGPIKDALDSLLDFLVEGIAEDAFVAVRNAVKEALNEVIDLFNTGVYGFTYIDPVFTKGNWKLNLRLPETTPWLVPESIDLQYPVGHGIEGMWCAIEQTLGMRAIPEEEWLQESLRTLMIKEGKISAGSKVDIKLISKNAPCFSPEARVATLFLVTGADTLPDMKNILSVLGDLLDFGWVQELKKRFAEIVIPSDPTMLTVPLVYDPDWKALRLKDLFPGTKKVEKFLEGLLGYFEPVEQLKGLVEDAKAAIDAKISDMQSLVGELRAVWDGIVKVFEAAGFYGILITSDLENEPVDEMGMPILSAMEKIMMKVRQAPGLPFGSDAFICGMALTVGTLEIEKLEKLISYLQG